jgi:hypothetical protein
MINLKSIGNTGDAAITAGSGYLKGILVHTDGSQSVTFDVYDNASAASGSKLFSTLTVVTSATNRSTAIDFGDQECPFVNGIYVNITTSGSVTYDVYWKSN